MFAGVQLGKEKNECEQKRRAIEKDWIDWPPDKPEFLRCAR